MNPFARCKRPFESLYKYLMGDATKRGKTVELTFEQFLEFTEQPLCHYCSEPVEWQPFRTHRGNSSRRYNLDRKDNNAGYCQSNLVVCCWPCNDYKRKHTYEWMLANPRQTHIPAVLDSAA